MAPLFGYTISNTPIIILFINFFIIFAYELIKQLHRNGIYKKVGLPVALASLMLISNGSFLIVGLWHLNNNPSIIILFLLAIIFDNCVENKDIGTSIVAALLITALIFARIEMLLYCAIILLGISTLGVTRQQMLIIFSILLLLC